MGSHVQHGVHDCLVFLFCCCVLSSRQETTTATTPSITTTPRPCWMDAINKTKTENHITCEVCTVIFQGLDDYFLDNEDQIAHALENLCQGSPWLFEVCWRLVEVCMDDIIEMLVENGLNPTDMC